MEILQGITGGVSRTQMRKCSLGEVLPISQIALLVKESDGAKCLFQAYL